MLFFTLILSQRSKRFIERKQVFYTNRLRVSVRGLQKVRETIATLGFMLFFAGAMIDISGSLFVTQGGVSPAVYVMVGIIELVGSLVFLIGIYLIVKTR